MPLTKADIARLRSLQEKKHREALGLFVVEGEKVISELLVASYPFESIYATDGWIGDRTDTVTPEEMARISHYPTPANVLAVGRLGRSELASGEINQGLTLALDNIQDPGNVGTLLRIADWYACDRVLLSPDCADLFSQKVINASMGSFARMRVYTAPLADTLGNTTVPVLGCDLQGDDVHSLPPLRDAVIVIGNEGRGLSPAVQALISQRVTIPKFGRAESLNAAVAAAIVCDNLRRTTR